MKLLVLSGDGIGPEITAATVRAVEAVNHRLNLGLTLEAAEAGLVSLEKNGTTLTQAVQEQARAADGVILGPCDTIVYPDVNDGGINPSAWLRKNFDLYANMRPSLARAGAPAKAPDIDLVIARENTEGFYADRSMFAGSGEFMPTKDVALAVRKITREGSRRIVDAACKLAMKRRKKLCIVHKRNVFRMSDGLFYDVAQEVAAGYDGLEVEDTIVDAMAALLIRRPESFDVVVTTNMYGDILSDLAAELSGGLGLGPSLNAGDDRAIAQAAHGSAPDIAGQNIANPVALMASASMLLNWLGERHERPDLVEAATRLDDAIGAQIAENGTKDLGGTLGTDAFGDAVANRIVNFESKNST
ncbi:MAG: isocitrate/isopropylmalate dehydrogenase family protein [Alphaproteobacteria bacterium]|nr:isocitrate/isopropylmalate dehydrogenase family protein [Alphaproteobacteria bacterium]